jgi:glutathione synthase/RimK-type ligase-like ATP-grasp enzyme
MPGSRMGCTRHQHATTKALTMAPRDTGAPIGVLYEHPQWFEPMFDEMDRRGLSYERIDANRLTYDPSETSPQYSLVINRMSPSSWLRGGETALFATADYLRYLDAVGVSVINGHESFGFETSKARQLALMARLSTRHPTGRIITNPLDAPAAADGLDYPVLVKPNVGGSGSGIISFDDPAALGAAAKAGALQFGPDHTAIVQEHLPAEGDAIVRVEFLNGRFLYAIRLLLVPGSFNLCPADYCDLPGIGEAVLDRGSAVEAFTPPDAVIDEARRILAATGADLGGVEYLINARDGHAYFYDVNALSNFVADAPNVIGFDPFVDLVDYVVGRLDAVAVPA